MYIFGFGLIITGFIFMFFALYVYCFVAGKQRRCCIETVGWRCDDATYGYRIAEDEYYGNFSGPYSKLWIMVRYNPEMPTEAYVLGDWKREKLCCQCFQISSFLFTVIGLWVLIC